MFIRIHETSFTRPSLLSICKIKGISKVSKYKKKELVNILQCYYARLFIYNYIFKKIRKIEYINYQDPITLMDISHPYISLEIVKRKVVRYNAQNIYDYILNTGNLVDPFTSTEFTDEQIIELDKQLSLLNINKIQLFTIKYNSNYKKYYKEKKEKEDELLGIDRQIGEVVSETLDLSDNILRESIYGDINESLPVYYYDLVNNLLPTFSVLFRRLCQCDQEYAKNAGSHYLSTIKNNRGVPSVNDIIKKHIISEIEMIN